MGEAVPPDADSGAGANVISLSVVLVLETLDPLIVNPDHLQRKRIVEKIAKLDEPALASPEMSRVAFDGSFIITAERQKLVLEQKGAWLNPEGIRIPDIAIRFLQASEGLHCSAIGINPVAHKAIPSPDGRVTNRLLVSQGESFKQGSTLPGVSLKAVYPMGAKTVYLDVFDGGWNTGRGVSPGVLFKANTHWPLRASAGAQRDLEPAAVLGSWKSDLSEFLDLVEKFSVWERQS